jgi:SAM-dependent methyltransferase
VRAEAGDGEGFFGEGAAAVYDEPTADMFDPAVVTPVVQMLEELSAGGGALEFGIGTGRIALPLTERGIRVAGIDSSEAMAARLRAKPGGEEIDVPIGDFATTRVLPGLAPVAMQQGRYAARAIRKRLRGGCLDRSGTSTRATSRRSVARRPSPTSREST